MQTKFTLNEIVEILYHVKDKIHFMGTLFSSLWFTVESSNFQTVSKRTMHIILNGSQGSSTIRKFCPEYFEV